MEVLENTQHTEEDLSTYLTPSKRAKSTFIWQKLTKPDDLLFRQEAWRTQLTAEGPLLDQLRIARALRKDSHLGGEQLTLPTLPMSISLSGFWSFCTPPGAS